MSTYSGEISNGLNMNASYDRIYYHNKFESFEELLQEWSDTLSIFKQSNKTRLVFNVLVNSNQKAKVLKNKKLFNPGKIEALFGNENGTINEGYETLIVGLNKKVRDVHSEFVSVIKQKIINTIRKNCDNQNTNLDRIEYLVNEGYTFNTDPDEDDLNILWAQTFNWSQSAIEKEISRKLSTILTLKSPNGKIISGGMVSSSGESTEWSTNQEYQRQGFILPLLMVLHAYAIKTMGTEVYPITSEARFDRSIKPGLLSGMEIETIDGKIGMHLNHVTIGGEEGDQWNSDKGIINGLDFTNLRSFVSMKLKKQYYNKNLIDKILLSARI